MKNWIRRSYIYPQSKLYQGLRFLDHHFIFTLMMISTLLLGYPLFNVIYTQLKLTQQQSEQKIIHQQLTQQAKLLHSLEKHNIQKHQQDHQFEKTHQQISQILEKHHFKPENLQWDLNHEKTLYITLNQQAENLFKLLNEINQLTYLYPKEITLTKLHQHRQVQLNGIFILTY